MDQVTCEKIDTILIYSEAGKNLRATCRLHTKKYPNKRHLSHRTFHCVVQQFTTTINII